MCTHIYMFLLIYLSEKDSEMHKHLCLGRWTLFYLFFNARGIDSTWHWPVTCHSLNHLCNSRPSATKQQCITVHIGRCKAEVRQKWGALLRISDQWAPLEPRDRTCDLSTVETPLAQTNLEMDKTTQFVARGKAVLLEISPGTSRPTVPLRRQRGLTCCFTKHHLLWVRQWLGREWPGNCCPKGLEAQPVMHGFLHKSWSVAEGYKLWCILKSPSISGQISLAAPDILTENFAHCDVTLTRDVHGQTVQIFYHSMVSSINALNNCLRC